MPVKNLFKDLENKNKKIALIGLGYVGFPLLMNLSKYFKTIGYDIDETKVKKLKNKNNIVEKNNEGTIDCVITSDEKNLETANFFIIAVPTPIDKHNDPDLSAVLNATRIVGKNMPKNSIVVYESTVYPGATEEVCIPLLEKVSGYKNKTDFHIGYSPERINPGDKIHTLENIVKVVSAQDRLTLDIIEKVYSKIIEAGTYRAESIKIAEAAKVIENIQRDLNIALVNEFAIIFSKLGLDTTKIINAANTKWNFLNFKPGLVGGHCIGVDPYYLTYKAQELGYHTEIILAGRRINDNMSNFIGNEILKRLLNNHDSIGRLKLALFGATFKENTQDVRNSKIIDLYNYFIQYGINALIYDPVADRTEVLENYNINLIEYNHIKDIDAAVFCVAHDCFKNIDLLELKSKFRNKKPYIFDIKGIFQETIVEEIGYRYWRL
ncbi:MAG: nucleotide sugar dehydrogenase [Actinomycetia bacterium]|nr:nucleotide sugar dehydrogenase [Actinomycetes bacterium]